jgi:hypothetical protein
VGLDQKQIRLSIMNVMLAIKLCRKSGGTPTSGARIDVGTRRLEFPVTPAMLSTTTR